jgi:arylsulfatase A-like enzyme
MSRSEWRWWLLHGREIVNTMAAPYAADVVGLLRNDTSYGVAGDHGGAQEPVQRIPIVFAGAGVGRRDSWAPIRSVDILPTILRKMRLRPDPDVDGRAYRLPGR